MTDSTHGASLVTRLGCLKADPTGAQVVYRQNGADRLADVVGFYYRDGYGQSAGWMLKIRHFNGEDAGEVSLGAVRILNRR